MSWDEMTADASGQQEGLRQDGRASDGRKALAGKKG